MDGFENSSNIIVIGATNQHDKIDEALLRPGRFDWKIEVHLPELQERIDIFKLKLKTRKNKVTEEQIVKCADLTRFFSGSEIEVVVNESASKAIWESLNDEEMHTVFIENKHIEEASLAAVEEKKKFIEAQSKKFDFRSLVINNG